jgi:hypothetical protein
MLTKVDVCVCVAPQLVFLESSKTFSFANKLSKKTGAINAPHSKSHLANYIFS